jgi:hypothetical protein
MPSALLILEFPLCIFISNSSVYKFTKKFILDYFIKNSIYSMGKIFGIEILRNYLQATKEISKSVGLFPGKHGITLTPEESEFSSF